MRSFYVRLFSKLYAIRRVEILMYAALIVFAISTIQNIHQESISQRLVDAVQAHDSRGVKTALALGATPDTRINTDAPRLPWHLAALGVVRSWFHNTPHYVSPTALVWAVHNDDIATMKTLLEHGADPNARGTAIDAFQRGLDADMDATPIMEASVFSSANVVNLLAKHGGNVNATSRDGETALMLASQAGRANVVKALIAQGADVNLQNGDGETALMLAVGDTDASVANPAVVKLLLHSGAGLAIQDHGGRTALGSAKEYGKMEIVQLIKEATVSSRGIRNRTTPL